MDRISELTRIARERELTPDEQAERKALREEYIADWRSTCSKTHTSTTATAASQSCRKSAPERCVRQVRHIVT